MSLLMVVVAAVLQLGVCQYSEKYQEEAGQIYTTVFHKYNPKVRPPDYYPKSILVKVQATLFHIRSLDITQQELSSVLDTKISWQDSRLSWYANQVKTISVNVKEVWSPSIVYLNSVLPPSPMFESRVAITSKGVLTWSRRELVTTVCRSDLQNANQSCDISLGFTSPDQTESFDKNSTSFSLVEHFTNHIWTVDSDIEIDEEMNATVLHFRLSLMEVDSGGTSNVEDNQNYTSTWEKNNSAGNLVTSGVLVSRVLAHFFLVVVVIFVDFRKFL